MCHLVFRDHMQIERELRNVASDKSTAEYIANNIIATVNLKSINQPLTKEPKDFLENKPKEFRKKLFEWGILGASFRKFKARQLNSLQRKD